MIIMPLHFATKQSFNPTCSYIKLAGCTNMKHLILSYYQSRLFVEDNIMITIIQLTVHP